MGLYCRAFVDCARNPFFRACDLILENKKRNQSLESLDQRDLLAPFAAGVVDPFLDDRLTVATDLWPRHADRL